jgi:hypothetical protein
MNTQPLCWVRAGAAPAVAVLCHCCQESTWPRRYTRFLGNSSDWRQYSNPAWYEANAADTNRVYAWYIHSTGCPAVLPYICEFPSSFFTCYPP